MTDGARELDFASYVRDQDAGSVGGTDEAARYAFGADLAMLRTFKRLRPVELAAAAIVRSNKELMKNKLLGSTVRVSKSQFPSVYKLAEECAETLGVPVPTIYVANNPYVNAMTFGTEDDSFIILHSSLVDLFDEKELKFVIGHETGHIQNKHVVYGTILQVLIQGGSLFWPWILLPARVPLSAWFRRAEVTCDRAGLLCMPDLDAASRSFLKLAVGSRRLFAELDVDEFVRQAREGRVGVGRFSEAFETHPYLPKRIEALRFFSESELFRKAAGLGEGGLTMAEVDQKTIDVIQIVKEGRGDGAGGTFES